MANQVLLEKSNLAGFEPSNAESGGHLLESGWTGLILCFSSKREKSNKYGRYSETVDSASKVLQRHKFMVTTGSAM